MDKYFVLHSTKNYLSFVLSKKEGTEPGNKTKFKTYKINIMKSLSQTLFNKAGKTTGKNSVTGMEENPEKAISGSQSKTFSSVDMWNIHRQRRSIVIR
jgi:hypothetical protein